jgi:hypothetical protein
MSTRINPTVALTLALLFFMVVAGIVSASWGYALGRQALKGITQPDVRPNSGVSSPQGNSAPRREGFVLLREEDILVDVEARMKGNAEPADADAQSNAQTKAVMEVSATSSDDSNLLSPATATSAQFPIASTDKDVTLEVRSGYEHDGELILEVSLQNSGSNTIQFLYSFMEVTDSQGRIISANTQGLPAELPPNGEKFSGVVSVPMELLNGADSISLALFDYPDQQIRLQLAEIPVMR